jgi:glycosyltransferase involved in cell wall biosynthesis
VTPAQPPEILSILVPVFNERRTVQAVIDRLLAIELPVAREVIVIDDGSTDGTREELAGAAGQGAAFTFIQIEHNRGKGHAIRTGFSHAKGSIVAIQDADLELDPEQLASLVEPILRGETEVVYGSRFMNGPSGAPWFTDVANRVLTSLTNVLYGSSLTDMETCYKVMRTAVARSLALRANRFEIEPEITAQLIRRGHGIMEIPVRFDPRSKAQGKKMRWRDGVHAIWVLVRERFR